MKTTTFALVPRDGLFLKDGRGWYTSDVGRSHGHHWPLPPTIRGALRHAYGHALMAHTGAVLEPGDWERESAGVAIRKLVAFRRRIGATRGAAPASTMDVGARLWPCPADAWYGEDGEIRRLRPEPPRRAGLHDRRDPARARLWRPYPDGRKPGPRPLFWPDEVMVRWLRGDDVHEAPGVDPTQRTDMHVTITPESQTATQSMLFSSEVTETMDRASTGREEGRAGAVWGEWGLAVECALPAHDLSFPQDALTLGGRRRLARVEDLSQEFFAMPDSLAGDSPGLRLILATPGRFAQGWLPDELAARDDEYRGYLPGVEDEVILRAALVPPPLNLSTWDMRQRAPRPTWRLVRPGAVYCFDKANGHAFTSRELQRLWLAQIGGGREEGFGLLLPGRWHHQ